MKIIKQSFEILPELDDPIKQIASRSRVCYKSEDKAKEDEKPFLKRIWKHQPVFEMAVVTIRINYRYEFESHIKMCKYLHVTGSDHTYITGSVRAWNEYLNSEDSDPYISSSLMVVLNEYNSFLFPGKPENHMPIEAEVVTEVPEAHRMDHEHVAVKFITNRAVSHELVRHRPCAFLQESQRYCNYGSGKFDNKVTFIEPTAFSFNDHEMYFWKTACEQAEDRYLELLRSNSPQAARTVLPNSCKTEIIVYCNLNQWKHIFNMRTSSAADPAMVEAMIPVKEAFVNRYPDMFN